MALIKAIACKILQNRDYSMKFLNQTLKVYLVVPIVFLAGSSGAVLGQFVDALELASRWTKVNEMYYMLKVDVSRLTLEQNKDISGPPSLKEPRRVWYQRCLLTPRDTDCPSTIAMSRVQEINEEIAQLQSERNELKDD